MSHIPYGYEVKDGKIFIVEEAADKVRQIFQNYVSGMSLTESAKTAGHPITHSMVKHFYRENVTSVTAFIRKSWMKIYSVEFR